MPNRRHEYRDADKARKTWAKQKRRYRSATGSGYGGREWTSSEIDLVLAHEVPDRELALRLGRSVAAIHVKRSKLKSSASNQDTKDA